MENLKNDSKLSYLIFKIRSVFVEYEIYEPQLVNSLAKTEIHMIFWKVELA
jgi:hypothetical protein